MSVTNLMPERFRYAHTTGLERYIATGETSKHRFFTFLDKTIVPDHMLIAIALDDAYLLGVLSSRIHVTWALAAGGRLGVGNDPRYNKSRCFDPFSFPDCDDEQKERIRELAEKLDAHRKRQQAAHPGLTMTEMYNVLERMRAGAELTDKERAINDAGLVSVLREIHDGLDAEVTRAYNLAPIVSDEEILQELVRLNGERAAEERGGTIRWLRPAYQDPSGAAAQTAFAHDDTTRDTTATSAKDRAPFPKSLADQARAVRHALQAHAGIVTADELAKSFQRAPVARVAELLDTLASLGQARSVGEGRYVA